MEGASLKVVVGALSLNVKGVSSVTPRKSGVSLEIRILWSFPAAELIPVQIMYPSEPDVKRWKSPPDHVESVTVVRAKSVNGPNAVGEVEEMYLEEGEDSVGRKAWWWRHFWTDAQRADK